MHNDFSYGLKKPRNQVQYARPFGGYVAKHKTNNQRTLPSRRIDSEKRVSDRPRSSRRNLELRACGANLLVTVEDKGWRESGAQIVLELADSNEWRLAVKLSGITRYSYKVQHNLQPGSTNRYTHAMMWKGGTDWLLEFSNRSQWIIFKELHEECHNRNIRASSVKSIPIPGVRLIEESDDCATEVPVVQNSSKYFHQVQTDVEMAMNPSHIFYDMDSEDEQWLVSNKKSSCTDENSFEEISEEMFEKIMDMYEKFSYVKHHSHFTFDEIEDLMVGIGSMEVAKVIYEHWRQKRERKGTPLMRQLQPPLWESYQKELKEWELAVARGHNAVLVGNPEKASPPEKPPMFAFCLKPRGLDVPKKCSKQRSKRKFSISGYNRAVSSGNLDGLPAFGRRSNGVAFGDDKVVFPRNVAESFDALSSPQTSTSVLSPREADRLGLFSLSNDMFEWDLRPKIYKKETKKIHSLSSFNNKQMIASHHQISLRNRNGLPEGSNQKHQYFEGPHKLGVELLDASGAAQHARDMAKLKRDKAHRLHYRAELAIHKAAVALLTADAVKAVAENSNGDG
ncbi:Enhancer of polycomb-like transcription factor protein [Abeliophyllum distichum]|uniref:Enhancer of polycomb-like protein n=1 Tax=Abeliophyllum distichum TaxID=126358 RepID=A0ABD1UKC9_9LAMI